MNLNVLKSEMKNAYPPYQPWVKYQTDNYYERTIHLNPLSIKSNVFFYQFTVKKESTNKIFFVADQSDKLIFKCVSNQSNAYFVGASDTYTEYDFEPNVTYFIVQPYSNFGLVKLEATPKELRSQFELSDLFNAGPLIDKIAAAESFDERVFIFKDYYLNHLVNYNYSPSLEELTASIIYSKRLSFSMSDVSSTIGYSKRYLNTRFNSEYNITPMKYARIAKFQDSLHTLIEDPNILSIADIAHQYGYYDESHLTKDFKTFSGLTPKNLRNLIHSK